MAATDPRISAHDRIPAGLSLPCWRSRRAGSPTGRRARERVRPGPSSREAGGEAPKKGGTLRVGFYIEAATMDPHLSGSKVDRQIYHNIYEPLLVLDAKLGIKPGLAESWQQPDPKTLDPQAAPGREVPRRHGLQRRGGEVQLQSHEDRAQVGAQGRGRQHRHGGRGRRLHGQAQPASRPDAALLATLTDRAGMMVSPKIAQERGSELERNAKGAGTGPFEFVEWVKDDHLLIKRNESYWNKQGGPYLDQIRYRPDPGRHREAPEPAGGRDRRDGLRPAARRGRGQGRQERGRARRAVARRRSPTSSTTRGRRSTTRPCARRWRTRSTSSRSSRACG